jgi:amino acid transporter
MLVTVFLFVGIEGASVYSRYAKRRADVGITTVLGFLGILCLLILVTMLSLGVLLRPDLAALPAPSMAGVLEAPGTILFVIARREQGQPVFTRVEWLLFGVVAAVAIGGLYGLATGAISI